MIRSDPSPQTGLRLAPVLALLALLLPALARPASGQAEVPAARAGDTLLSRAELDRLLVDRYALSPTGRAALLHLLKGQVLELFAKEAGLEVAEAEVDQRVKELERELRIAGEAKDLAEYLKKQRVKPEIFRRYMRLGVVQETLARRALGIPPKSPISGEQQEAWLEGRMAELGIEELPAPWSDGVVARCGPVRVRLEDFLAHLLTQLDPKEVREACQQLLVAKRLRARMPDLSDGALQKLCVEEVERRGKEILRDPKYEGVSYAQLLASQGIRFEAWPNDPNVRIGVLARVWVERSYEPEALRRVYADEREHFDGLYGEAIQTWAIFLKAGRFENELLTRTYEEAEAELAEIASRVRGQADFKRFAAMRSEDAGTREKEGLVGWVTRAGEERHLALRKSIFAALDGRAFDPDGPVDARERMLGPLRTSTGCVLFWLGARRPPPAWEVMVQHVVAELRRRFVESALGRDEMVLLLDPE